ncbi:MAG: DeoR/GlpR transcriptional regulator [Clostridiales bacterium]|nr:DeoR/GlpR transcriptional regulator [Clostridiales bacterium]
MLPIERRNKIIELLQEEKKVVVTSLSSLFGVTEETIRRDLEKLEKEGIATKTYGGAVLNEDLRLELPYKVRKGRNATGKQIIGKTISSFINDGDHIMLDGSSTALYIAKNLKDKKNLTIITNSIEILLELSDVTGWNVLSTGGILKEGALALVGYQAERMIQSYNVDKAIISCKGIDIEKGITDSNELDSHIKKLMIDAAKTRILAVDSTKFEKVSFTKIVDYSKIDVLVTDHELNDDWKQALDNYEIEVIEGKQN